MYTLNIIRLIGLIFICSRLILIVKATDGEVSLPTCEGTTAAYCAADTTGTEGSRRKLKRSLTLGNYCKFTANSGSKRSSGTISLYYVGENNACKQQTTAGTYVFSCNTSYTSCSKVTTTYSSNSKYLSFTITSGEGGTTTTVAQTKDGYSFDSTNKKLLKCESTGACTIVDKVGYYLVDANTLVSVKVESSKKVASSVEIADGTYYYPDDGNFANDAYSKIISCTKGKEENATVSCESKAPTEAGIYINAGGTVGSGKKGLIKCTASGEMKTCETKDATSGYYYAGADKKLIQCTSSCGVVEGEISTTGVYLDGLDAISGSPTKYKSLIQCTTSAISSKRSSDESNSNEANSTPSCEVIPNLDAGIYINAGGSVGSGKKGLINCTTSDNTTTCETKDATNGDYYVGSASELILCGETACNVVDDPSTTGYYLDGIGATKSGSVIKYKSLIQCTEGSSNQRRNEGSEGNNNTLTCSSNDPAKDGIYINAGTGNKGLIQCTTSSNKVKTCVTMDAKLNDVYIDVTTQDESDTTKYASIIKCVNESTDESDDSENNQQNPGARRKRTAESTGTCTTSKASESTGTYLNAAVTTGLGNAIITCTSESNESQCEVTDGVDGGFYENTIDPTVIIRCQGGSCTNTSQEAEGNYYIDVNENLISCVAADSDSGSTGDGQRRRKRENGAGDDSFTCTSAEPSEDGHYLNAGDGKSVITCIASGSCSLEDGSIKGYFLNSGSTTDQHVISCNGTKCEASTDADSASDPGSVKYADSKATLCVDSECSDDNAVEIKIDSDSEDADTYKSITVEAGKFPGASAGIITVKIGKDGTAILMEDGGLPTCGSTCTPGVHCIKNGVINTAGTGKTACSGISITAGKSYYFDSDNMKIDSVTTETPPAFAYLCSSSTSCTLVKGTVKDGDNYVQCSGWKRDPCTVITSLETTCSEGNDGVWMTLSDKPALCFQNDSENGLLIPESGNNYALFVPTEANSVFGVSASTITAIELSANSAIVSTTGKL